MTPRCFAVSLSARRPRLPGVAGISRGKLGVLRLPGWPAVGGLPEDLRSEEENARVGGREDDGSGAVEPIFGTAQRYRSHALDLARRLVVPGEVAAVDHAGV